MVRGSGAAFKRARPKRRGDRPRATIALFCGTLRAGLSRLPSSRSASLVLSLRNAYEALAVSAPTVVDAARGRLRAEDCDERLERFAAHVVQNADIRVDVRGRDHLDGSLHGDRRRAFVVMSNHQSHYDVPVLYHVLGGNMRMVAKKELFGLPLFGRAIRDAGMIEVDRGNRERAIASLQIAKEKLAAGTNIWIAPEGTRSPTGELLSFKKGGFVLALDMEAPVLPITIQGTRAVLPAKGMRSRRGVEVEVTIHPVIETAEIAKLEKKAARDTLMTEVRRAIASAL
ncbi:MAG: 1-acyl-sn-glycerol-3-phosphate acyltransferase [Labilithrix sp.]|nr:1-acyl-sn-glycerol-3-phosphate acyltransferase [Labilithrix sp.]